MLVHRAFEPAIVLIATVTLCTSCATTDDPFTSGPGRASVSGVVADPGGQPIPGVTISIACAGGGAPLLVTTDSTGHYLTNLNTGADPFDGPSGHLPCHFAEPATPTTRVQVDTLLVFARGPVLVALQFVDLHEP